MPQLTIELRNEQGDVLDSAFDEGAVARLRASFDDQPSVCLRFIDPYGDTVFNPSQAAVLGAELRAALATVVDGDDRARVDRVADIADRCASGLHIMLWFIGD